jgi:hypothetical protein
VVDFQGKILGNGPGCAYWLHVDLSFTIFLSFHSCKLHVEINLLAVDDLYSLAVEYSLRSYFVVVTDHIVKNKQHVKSLF